MNKQLVVCQGSLHISNENNLTVSYPVVETGGYFMKLLKSVWHILCLCMAAYPQNAFLSSQVFLNVSILKRSTTKRWQSVYSLILNSILYLVLSCIDWKAIFIYLFI